MTEYETSPIWKGVLREFVARGIKLPATELAVATREQGYASLCATLVQFRPPPPVPEQKRIKLPTQAEVLEAAELGFTRMEAMELIDLPSHKYLVKVTPERYGCLVDQSERLW